MTSDKSRHHDIAVVYAKENNNIPVKVWVTWNIRKRRGGLMINAFSYASSGLGSSPGWGHCVVFLGKTLYTLITSFYPGV